MKPPHVALSRAQIHALQKWAERNQPTIKSIRFFGSRVSQHWCTCSDVDLAVGLRPGPHDTNVIATYVFAKGRWVQELTDAIGAQVDFQMYRAESPHVQRYCRRANVIVWPRRHVLPTASRQMKCGMRQRSGPLHRLARKIHVSRKRRPTR
jgi:predicted nucleotidyltransferase